MCGYASAGYIQPYRLASSTVNGTKAAFKITASASPVSKLSTLYMSPSDHNLNDDSFLIFGSDVGLLACVQP